MRVKLTLLLALISSASHGDTVRLSDGNSCTFDAGESPWELSVEGKQIEKDTHGNNYAGKTNDANDEYHVTAKIKYSFGGPRRLDCSRLYEMQLRTKEAELKALQEKVKMLEKSKSIDWN